MDADLEACAKLVESILAAPKPPCDMEGGCPFRERCRDQELACAEFYAYTRLHRYQSNHMGIATPSKALYQAIYAPQHGGVRTRGASYVFA